MSKERILATSHFRKNKGSSVGIFILMLIASLLLCTSMILFTDTYPTAKKEAERLEGGDGFLYFTSEIIDETDPVLQSILTENTARCDVSKAIHFSLISVPFGSAELAVQLHIETPDTIAEKEMAKTEIVSEDASITSDYIYLPYQFKTAGGFSIGDDFDLKIYSETYHLKVKGFLNSVYGGCNNDGLFEMVVPEDIYAKILSQKGDAGESTFIPFELKDGVKASTFRIRLMNTMKSMDPLADIHLATIGNTLSGRSFMSLIIAGSFLAITVIVMIVVILMIVNSISNYVKENMKTIGALKAIGYTGRNIKVSLLLIFLTLALIGSFLGILVSYLIAGPVSSVVIAQMGIPYSISFSLISTITAIAAVLGVTVLVTLLSLRRINRIQPIVALREGTESHSFRTNPVKLEKSILELDASLSLKTMIHNKKQNIITFFVMGFLIFLCTIALLMFENFNHDPKLNILVSETCDGLITFDKDTKVEAETFLSQQEGVSNIRRSYIDTVYVGEENSLYLEAFEDPTKKENIDVCYKGRLPSHDNEINISGLFAKNEGYEIGDEITITLGDRSATYLITGFIQTTNNGGGEGIMTESGYAKLADLSMRSANIYFDTDKDEQIDPILQACKEKFGEGVTTSANFLDLIEANMITFRGIATLMLTMVISVSVMIILLVLFLLIRSLVFSKRKDYGIYKAIGYTSKSLILQTAGSFMPAIILSVIVFSIISYFVANPYMQLIMINFGLMKCTFDIPIPGLVVVGAAMILISFLFAVLQARRIKKVEPYQMLVAE